MNRIRAQFRRLIELCRDRRGSIFMVAGVATPVLLGVLGLGTDAGIWFTNKRVAQTQTDAAAISGGFERARMNPTNVTAAAQKEAIRNGFTNTAPNTLVINNPPTTGPNAGEPTAVEVIMTTRQPLMFAKLFIDNVSIRTRAVAAVQTTGSACVLALDPTAGSALKSSGSATVNMPGCVMASNSASASAISIGGSTQINADSLWTVGNYETQGGSSALNLEKPPVINAWPLDDPYASAPVPLISGNTATYNSAGNGVPVTVNPGTYPKIDIKANDVVTFNPGTYYLNGGDFAVAGGATVRCNCAGDSGVTIVLTSMGGASVGTVTINANADIQLEAPATGPYAGLVFYQDPREPSGSTVAKFNGGATMNITGTVYFPDRPILWAGNNSPSGPSCTQIIGRTVEFTGSSVINNTGCIAAGVEPITITGVRIVE